MDRDIAGLSLFSAGAMGVIALYQTGVLKRLPDPPGFDSARVVTSPEARRFGVPDGLLGLASYGITAALALAGAKGALVAKVTADAAVAAKLTADEWRKHHAFCFWCLLATGATAISAALAWKEASAGWTDARTSN
ncbi:MAG TPA: vitamin K epoxide reductase family protein [Bryobacteraceae bacterium]|nr:vitamin K epoxide reductase family protein [Bryobacteraceae bacterium]